MTRQGREKATYAYQYHIRYLKEGRLVRATPWSGVLDAAKTLARERLITMKAQGAATVAEVTDAAGKVVCSIRGDDADRT